MAWIWRCVTVAAVFLLAGSCSSDGGEATTTTSTLPRPAGPAAQLRLLPADGEVFMGSPAPYAADPPDSMPRIREHQP